MYILKHYFKPENKTDNSEFTIFGMKMGPVATSLIISIYIFFLLHAWLDF